MQNDKNIRKTIPEPLMFIHTVSTPILSNGSKKYYDSREASNKTNASTIPTIIPDEVLLERNRGRTIDRLLYQKIQNIIQMYEKGHPIPCLIETRNNESFEGVPTLSLIHILKRKVDLFLKEWRENINRKPLIISGARQIGKTTSIRAVSYTHLVMKV